MYEQVEKSKENKSKVTSDSVFQKKRIVKQGFGFVDNRLEAIAQRKLKTLINHSSRIKQSKLQNDQNVDKSKVKQLSVIQRMGSLDANNGVKKGFLDSTVNRFQFPKPNLGSALSFRLMASVLISPLLANAPRIPSQFQPCTAGYAGGFIGGTMARKVILRRIGIPTLADTLMTLSNMNNVAIRIDEQFDSNPALIGLAELFVEQVAERARQQHQRTNPYMTPNNPESIAEIQSPFY